jgi:hypothetical protein
MKKVYYSIVSNYDKNIKVIVDKGVYPARRRNIMNKVKDIPADYQLFTDSQDVQYFSEWVNLKLEGTDIGCLFVKFHLDDIQYIYGCVGTVPDLEKDVVLLWPKPVHSLCNECILDCGKKVVTECDDFRTHN